LLEPRSADSVVAEIRRYETEALNGPQTECVLLLPASGQSFFEPSLSLPQVPTHPPEIPEAARQAQLSLPVTTPGRPTACSSQIVELSLQAAEPHPLFGSLERCCRALDKRYVIGGVLAP